MFGSKKKAEQSERKSVFDEAADWENARVHQIEKSERRAWFVAGSATLLAVCLGAGIALMMPLKTNTPYVIRVDSATGVPDIVTAMTDKPTHYDTVMDKYWLAHYVLDREGYDWYTLQKRYDEVGLLSSGPVGRAYAQLFQGPNALDHMYGKNVQVRVKVISVVPDQKGIGTVRFMKITKNINDPNTKPKITKWVATIGYRYVNPSIMKESQRLVNPFGFQVMSYRVDPEMGISK